MSEHITVKKPPAPPLEDAIAFSNSIRLTGNQWLGMLLCAVALVLLAPVVWKQCEDFPLETDYRMPHDLSQDYWLYERYAGRAVEKYDTVIIGDSVIWGEFVTRQETLSHYLNQQAGKERFANLGLDGAHPLALTGLVTHYASSVAHTNVILECNPLWLSSLQADLQGNEKVNEFNHPKLVPQFRPNVPRYQAERSAKLGILVEQRVAFGKWTNHLQQAYYEQKDMPGWTLEHPYDNPLAPLTRGLPESDNQLRHLQLPWYKTGKTQVDYEWVDMDQSLQWRAFQDVVEILQRRGNRVFVIVGPFNEHMLTDASLARYQKVKGTIVSWLKEKEIPHLAPSKLRKEQYADASHPLPKGYRMLAKQLAKSQEFQRALAQR